MQNGYIRLGKSRSSFHSRLELLKVRYGTFLLTVLTDGYIMCSQIHINVHVIGSNSNRTHVVPVRFVRMVILYNTTHCTYSVAFVFCGFEKHS